MRTHRLTLVFSLLILVAGHAQQGGGTKVSRQPPPAYEQFLAPLLTPLDEAMKLSAALKPDADIGGAVILNEILHRVDDDGGRLVVLHSIYRADSDAAAESLGDDTQSFRAATQKVHLALAQTISPDGTRTPVRPNATLIQSPQRSADQSLYSDAQELVIVYPKVKPGTLTESVVVIEEQAMRVPGEFMTSVTWSSGWPLGRKRVLIDLPEPLAARLRFSALGTGTPEAQRSDAGGGRVRFNLQRDGAPGYLHEIGRAPDSQAGPATWITSFADWDAFAAWYRPLIKDRATLEPPLAAKVDAWTAGAADEDEIIARLLRRAADDVRYTGLEFGISGLQPYDCNEVWENQYGDCKDKSNLLRAMLAHKGIRSYLTLLNTDHAGRIEKRSPDYRQFDHAILAVERGGGTLQFCDPTIEFALPGLLRPDDGDRDVLVIRDDRAQFVRTPAAPAGQLDYAFDLELSAAREVSGWLTLTCRGYYAASYGAYYSKKDRQSLSQALASQLDDFFPGAEVADVERPDLAGWDGAEYRLRAYFVAPGGGEAGLTLTFPHSDALFPELGDTKARRAPYYGWADQVSIDAKIRVPAAFGSARLPEPLSIDSSAISAESSWEFSAQDGGYRARLDVLVKKALLSPDEFQVAFGALNSIRTWLGAPLGFDASTAPPAAAGDAPVTLENFPMMPSAEGQLKLLDQRFPSDGNRPQRRAAMAKVLQFFPDDLVTRFAVESGLAELDWNEGKNAAAIERILKLLNSEASDAVGDEERAWAEYVLGFCYRDDGNPEKAKEIFKQIAQNADVSEFRRGWAGYQRLTILKREKDPDYEKLAAETDALIDFETEARAFLVALHGDFMARTGKSAELDERLRSFVAKKPNDLSQIIELLCAVARELPADQSEQLAKVIGGLPIAAGSPAAETQQSGLDQLALFRRASSSFTEIQQALRAFIAANPPDGWDAEVPATTAAAAAEQLDASEKGGDARSHLLELARYLTGFDPGERFPYFLWRMAAWSEYAERSGQGVFKQPILPLLLELCDKLPENDDYHMEGKFLRARHLRSQGKLAEETALFEELIGSGVLDSDAFVIAATAQLGESLQLQGQFDAARERFLELKPYTADYALANDGLFRAALISLEQGDQAAATAVLEQLSMTKAEVIDLSPNRAQIRSMTSLAQPASYWEASEKWWPAWEQLHAELLPDIGLEAVRVPVIGDLQAFGTTLRAAVRAQDSGSFYGQLDLLLRALRWSPEYLNDAASSLTFLAPSLSPDTAAGLRGLLVRICENFPEPSPENLRRLQLYRCLALIDSDKPAEALPIANQFFEVEPQRDPIFFSMVRLRAIAASAVDGADLEIPAKGLEEVLATSDNDDSRVQNVLQLARLYHQLERPDQEEALLTRELENPVILANADAAARLRERQQSLAREGSGGRNFSAATSAWLAAHGPAWLGGCAPHDLADARIGDNLERTLGEAGPQFSEEETIKLNLLAAGSEQLALEVRERAFATAFGPLLADAATHAQARAMVTGVLDQEGFPETLKQIVLFSALDDAIGQRRSGDITFLLAHPALDRDNERLRDLVETYGHLAAANFNSSASLAKVADTLAGDGLSGVELGAVMQCFRRMLELGDLDAATAIYKAAGDWKLDPDVRATSSAIRLNLLKVLKIARQMVPVTQGLHEQLAPLLGLDTISEPAWFGQRRGFADTSDLSIADTRKLRLFQVKSGHYDKTDPNFWFDVADAIQSPETVNFACKLLEIYLSETADDGRRSTAALIAPGIVDTDEPAVRERLGKIFAPYRQLADAPLTRDAIRLYEIQNEQIRAGQAIDIDEAFAGLTHPAASRRHIRAKLTALIQQEDRAKLRRYLERLSADQLLDPGFLTLTIPALDLAGLTDEAELARDTAAEKIPSLVAEGWHLPRSGSLVEAYQLATLLGQPQLVPPAAREQLLAERIRNERLQLGLDMAHYQLHQDWQKLETTASAAVEQFPTFYAFYLEKARALYHQGKLEAAIGPLEIFIRYSADDPEFTKAKRWLDEAKKAE